MHRLHTTLSAQTLQQRVCNLQAHLALRRSTSHRESRSGISVRVFAAEVDILLE